MLCDYNGIKIQTFYLNDSTIFTISSKANTSSSPDAEIVIVAPSGTFKASTLIKLLASAFFHYK